MSWINLTAINTSKSWQFSPEFSGEIIRLRHQVSGEFPYGARGLFAQNFDFQDELELLGVKKIFPFYGDDIFVVNNPFLLPQRIAIRGQTKYETAISWLIYIDYWDGDNRLLSSQLEKLELQIQNQSQEIAELKSAVFSILSKLEIDLPSTDVEGEEILPITPFL